MQLATIAKHCLAPVRPRMSTEVTLPVTGMTCGGCENAVQRARRRSCRACSR